MSQKGISGTRRPGLNNEAIHGILGATGDQRHWNAFSDRVPWYHIKKNKKLKKKITVPGSAWKQYLYFLWTVRKPHIYYFMHTF